MQLHEAQFYSRESQVVHCQLCPHGCRLREGQAGQCRVRQHAGGKLWATQYGEVTSWGMDPIEKKPLYHFYPGSEVLSVGSTGCTLACQFCQNWAIVHEADTPTRYVPPEVLVEAAVRAQAEEAGRCIGLAFTYSEPLVWYEYVADAAQLAHAHGLKTVLVTNGFIEPRPWQELIKYIDAVNVDVKGFRQEYYRRVCGGNLAPVKRAVELAHAAGVHVEITTLLVEGLNDGPEEIDQLARWAGELSPDLPLHLSRYFPAYRMDRPATSEGALKKAQSIAGQHLRYVYLGNIWGLEHHSTRCPGCGALLLLRRGLSVEARHLVDSRCQRCGFTVPIRGSIQ